jgi:hypothetical protein
MEFNKYMHLERLGNSGVTDINKGICYIFPKLDGTNASLWLNSEGELQAGSRNRHLSVGADNAGFLNTMLSRDPEINFLSDNPSLRLFGEWLVPHTLKTYRADAWRKFYVFDVFCDDKQRFLSYPEYKLLFDTFHDKSASMKVNFLAPIRILRNPSNEDIRRCVEENIFYIRENEGVGEGVVCKNYGYTNQWGKVVWAKVVGNHFKEKHNKEMGAPEGGGEILEEKIVREYIDRMFVHKAYNKILLEKNGQWEGRDIPRLLSTVWHDFINEEIWDILKKNKNPTIDFGYLNRLTVVSIKEHLKEEVFKLPNPYDG